MHINQVSHNGQEIGVKRDLNLLLTWNWISYGRTKGNKIK